MAVTPLAIAAFVAACSYDWTLPATPDDSGPPDGTRDANAPPTANDAEAFDCTGALLCSGFDATGLAAPWTGRHQSASGGVLVAEPFGEALSKPNVLRAARPATQTETPSTAYVTTVLPNPLSRATLRFSIRPEELDPNKAACVASIVFNDGSPDEHAVRMLLSGSSATIQEKAPAQRSLPLSSSPALGRWSVVSLSVAVGGNITVLLDGEKALDVPAAASWTASTATRVVVGINFVASPAAATSLRFDDVRLDGRP